MNSKQRRKLHRFMTPFIDHAEIKAKLKGFVVTKWGVIESCIWAGTLKPSDLKTPVTKHDQRKSRARLL